MYFSVLNASGSNKGVRNDIQIGLITGILLGASAMGAECRNTYPDN